jgi:hypothetical protein
LEICKYVNDRVAYVLLHFFYTLVLFIALPFPLTFSCPSNRGEQKVAGFMRNDININFKVRVCKDVNLILLAEF